MEEARQKALEVLQNSPIMILMTVDRNGYPTGRRIGFVNDGFTLYIPSPTTAIKLKQLARSKKATALVFDPATNRYLQIKADVELLDDRAAVDPKLDRYIEKYPRVAASMTPETRANRVMLRLTARSVRGDGVLGPMVPLLLEGDALEG